MKRNRGILGLVVLAIATSFFMLAVQPGVSLAKTTKTHMAKAKTVMVMGVLEHVHGEYVIKSGKTHHVLMGKEDFAKMVGHKVKAWGYMEKTKKGHVLKVTKIEKVMVKKHAMKKKA